MLSVDFYLGIIFGVAALAVLVAVAEAIHKHLKEGKQNEQEREKGQSSS